MSDLARNHFTEGACRTYRCTEPSSKHRANSSDFSSPSNALTIFVDASHVGGENVESSTWARTAARVRRCRWFAAAVRDAPATSAKVTRDGESCEICAWLVNSDGACPAAVAEAFSCSEVAAMINERKNLAQGSQYDAFPLRRAVHAEGSSTSAQSPARKRGPGATPGSSPSVFSRTPPVRAPITNDDAGRAISSAAPLRTAWRATAE